MKPAKKQNKRKPNSRQLRAIKDVVETGGRSISASMVRAGYSPATAKNPDKLTNSKAFKDLAADMLPDDLLLKVHKEGLAATKTDSLIVGYEPQKKGKSVPIVEIRKEPDFATRHRYLDTAYKIRGKIKQDTNVIVPMQVNVQEDRQKYS